MRQEVGQTPFVIENIAHAKEPAEPPSLKSLAANPENLPVEERMPSFSEILPRSYSVNRRLAVDQFKVCPLCGAVNVLANCQCFVCTWAGGFIHDEAQIETGLYQMIIRCPELLAILIDEEPVEPLGTWDRVRLFFCRLRKRIDVRA